MQIFVLKILEKVTVLIPTKLEKRTVTFSDPFPEIAKILRPLWQLSCEPIFLIRRKMSSLILLRFFL